MIIIKQINNVNECYLNDVLIGTFTIKYEDSKFKLILAKSIYGMEKEVSYKYEAMRFIESCAYIESKKIVNNVIDESVKVLNYESPNDFHYLTIGELKQVIKDMPDDGIVHYERIEDFYFTENNWNPITLNDYMWYGELREFQYVRAYEARTHKGDDKNIYLTAHY